MPQFWFKVYHPEQSETRIIWSDVPDNNDPGVYERLEWDVREVFKLDDDYKFYFLLRDKDNDEIAIKENYEILNYMFRMERNDKLKLTIVPVSQNNQEKRPMKDTQSDDSTSSVTLSESFQSIMKHLELGMSNLQATVEKNAKSVAARTVDTVVKTAAETAAHVYRSMLPPPTLSDKPQFDVICDGCYSPIRGQRWRCETCEDFDLCSTCKSRVNHNQTHNFRFIKKDYAPPSHRTQQENVVPEQPSRAESYQSDPSHTIFICDYCDSDIVGIRHTCGACPDFDLCHSCFAIVKENHPEHIFVTRLVGTQAFKYKKSKSSSSPKCKKSKHVNSPRQQSHDNKVPTVYHRGVECDNCESAITGIRYKCGHCANYDLCETCEEYALSIHDSKHAFIKIRYPIQSITKKPILPKFSPLIEKEVDDKPAVSSSSSSSSSSATTTAQRTNEMKMINAASSTNEIISKPEEFIASRTSSPAPAANIPPMSPPVIVNHIEPRVEQVLSAAFVSDINVPDGTLIVPKKTFIKMWKIVNNGNVDWPVGTHLLFNGGTILRPYPISRPDSFVVPVISPNEETCITAELQAPDCPGEYTSYFCLCTTDGVRFGDSLWCTIKVDEDQEPEVKKPGISAADIMMNSSNSMIYPTISTAALSIHQDQQQQQQAQPPNSMDGYTDQDDYSEFTSNDQVSTLTSENTHSYANSHVSSPSPSELDIGESNNHHSFFLEETTTEEEDNEEFINHAYQVISPSASTTLPRADTPVAEEEEGFVMVEEQEDEEEEVNTSNYESNNSSNNASSILSSNTITSKNINSHSDEFIYRSQLTQLHEMGFTAYDDLAMSLLKLHQGRVEVVIAKLLEYP